MSNGHILVCNAGINRIKTDPYIQNNLVNYLNEMSLVIANLSNGQNRVHESIGEFNVSPQSKSKQGIRIAWRFENRVIYFDDFLYHERNNVYVDNWGHKVLSKIITPTSYSIAGYIPIEQFGTVIAAI